MSGCFHEHQRGGVAGFMCSTILEGFSVHFLCFFRDSVKLWVFVTIWDSVFSFGIQCSVLEGFSVQLLGFSVGIQCSV